MQAYLINPETKAVETVEIGGEDDEILEILDASAIGEVWGGELDARILVEAEAGADPFRLDVFQLDGWREPLTGRALVVGGDLDAPIAPATVPLAAIKRRLRFPETMCGM